MAEYLDLAQARVSAQSLSKLAAIANDLERASGRWKPAEFKQMETSELLFRVALLCTARGFPVSPEMRAAGAEIVRRATTMESMQQPLPGMGARPKKRHTASIQVLYTAKNVEDLSGAAGSLLALVKAEEGDWEKGREAVGYAIATPLAAAMRRAAWTAGNWDTKESSGGRRSLSPAIRQVKGEEPRGRDERSYLYVLATGGPRQYTSGQPSPVATAAPREDLPLPEDFAGLAGLAVRSRLWDVTWGSGAGARGLAGLGSLGCCTSSRAFLAALKEMNRG